MAWINFFGDKVRIKDIFLKNGSCLADVFYPVGSIYISAASTSPADMFGGTWKRINGRVLIGAGQNEANTTNAWGSTSASVTNFPAGEMGGVYRHALSENELPEIRAWFVKHGEENGTDIYGLGGHATGTGFNGKYKTGNTFNGAHSYKTPGIKFGGNAAHNNMPPYLVVYMWQRTA